jgi:tRNA:m4X modification enzyme
MTEP